MTIYEIKQRTQESAPYFFTRNTLRFFGQVLKDFSVVRQPGGKFRICAPIRNSAGKEMGHTVRLFNPETNDLESDHTTKAATNEPVESDNEPMHEDQTGCPSGL